MSEENKFARSCMSCGDSGWISAVHKETHGQYSFRCGVCQSAKRRGLSEQIPMWTSAFKERFENYNEYLKRDGWKDIKKPENTIEA
jgi:hypothetical protein